MKTSAGKAVAGALLLLCPMLVFAQDAGGTEAVQTVLRSILSDTSNLISGSPFMAQGQKLLQMLLVILISWKGIKLALDVSGYSQVVAEIVNIVLLWGIASFFLTATVQKQFADGFTLGAERPQLQRRLVRCRRAGAQGEHSHPCRDPQEPRHPA